MNGQLSMNAKRLMILSETDFQKFFANFPDSTLSLNFDERFLKLFLAQKFLECIQMGDEKNF
jgi:hypothetical protein